MKVVYCANCGMRLNIKRKALPKYATIIDIVEFHICSSEPITLDLTPVDIPVFHSKEGNNQFEQNLDDLAPLKPMDDILGPLEDRRSADSIKKDSSAPVNLLEHFKQLKRGD